MKAKVQRFKPVSIEMMVSKERAVLPCGCSIFVGVRVDNHQARTVAQACCEEHQPVMARANDLLLESLASPSKRLLVDVCAHLLTQAARETGL